MLKQKSLDVMVFSWDCAKMKVGHVVTYLDGAARYITLKLAVYGLVARWLFGLRQTYGLTLSCTLYPGTSFMTSIHGGVKLHAMAR